jgi:hypothetical protein
MSQICNELHVLVNCLKRYNFPYNEKDIPLNGIHVLFQEGEFAHGGDRIVGIGTHTGINQFRSRLKQHFIYENKDRSIFRKNIGRALLNMREDSYIGEWELDLTTRKNKDKYLKLVDQAYQSKIENEVTELIQKEFSFTVLEELDKGSRLLLKSRIVSEVSKCAECKGSPNWIGKYSTKDKIRESGLWQENELYKKGFTQDEFDQFNNRYKL